MKKLIDNFDATFLINLPERKDRLAATVKEFARGGCVIGDTESRVKIIPGRKFEDADGFPSTGMRGSFNSHLSAIEKASSLKLRNALICEDDLSFNAVSQDAIEILLQKMPSDWDVIYFGYLEPVDPGGNPRFIPYKLGTIGGHLYAVNGAFFGTLLDYMYSCRDRPPGHPLGGKMGRDATFNQLLIVRPETRVFLASPNIAKQRSSRSDITPSRFDRVFPPQIMSIARSFRRFLSVD